MLTGCGGGPPPRLVDLIGHDAVAVQETVVKTGEWGHAIGLAVYSDATAPHAAPAITGEYLATLSRRTEELLRQRCSFQDILPLPLLSTAGPFSQELRFHSHRLPVLYVMVVVLSSRERSGPETLGEATMMTQMSGMVMENSAMAEVGILRVSDFHLMVMSSGWGTETLEELDSPLGRHRPSSTDARNILRARAGQQALDGALEHLESVCQRENKETRYFTDSFQIAGRVRSPVL